MLVFLLGYNKMASAHPHTLLLVTTKPLPYTSGYIHYTVHSPSLFQKDETSGVIFVYRTSESENT